MNREDIIKLALESDPAGIDGRLYHMACVAPETLERFVSLIAEDCAKRCEAESDAFREGGWNAPAAGAGTCADAIREAYKP